MFFSSACKLAMESCGAIRMHQYGVRLGVLLIPTRSLALTRLGSIRISSCFPRVSARILRRTFTGRALNRESPPHRGQIRSALRILNAEQAAAVETDEDCVRVVAGPGSGKTLVLTHRIAHLIKDRGVNPSNVLCITFTNKAAEELRQRLMKLLHPGVSAKLTLGTFHSVCARLLRECATKETVGVNKDFVIYDEQDSGRVVKTILEEILNRNQHKNMVADAVEESTVKKKKKLLTVNSKEVHKMLELIAGLKTLELKNFVLKQTQPYKLLEMPDSYKKVQKLANDYQNVLRSYNAVDFDDLIHLSVRLLYQRSDLWEIYQSRWSYVLADEFQDTDGAQYLLVRRLCMKNKKLFVVGDVDQAIYGWRGADYRNMQDLERHFPNLTTLELRRNYRSSQSILKVATEIIKQSNRPITSLRPLTLQAMKAGGSPVTIVHFDNSQQEAYYVKKKFEKLMVNEQASYGSFGILYRTRLQGQTFERIFIQSGVPYKMSGATALLSYKEVKDLRAYLQLAWNQEDGVALQRVINTPPRGLGSQTLKMVGQWAFDKNMSFPQALQKIVIEQPSQKDLGITAKARNSLLEFCKLISEIKELSHDGVGTVLQEVITRTRFVEYVKGLDENCERRVEHIEDFQALASEYGSERSSLSTFLEAIALYADTDEVGEGGKQVDAVRLSTLHAAKGLEFDYVFISGLEEGTLPHILGEMDEERRLFYVGVTRARKQLFITYRRQALIPEQGFRQTRISRFLNLPKNLYKEEWETEDSYMGRYAKAIR